MKLGKREQILLLVLVLILATLLPARFVFMPAANNYASNLQTLAELDAKQQEMQLLVQANPGMDDRVQQAQEAAKERSARFFPEFTNEQMGLWFFGFTEEAGLRNSSVAISERGTVYIDDYSDAAPELRIALSDLISQINGQSIPAQTGEEASSEPPAADAVFVNTVSVTADCYYDNLMYFVDLLMQSGRTLQVSGVEFQPRKDDSGVKGVVTATVTLQVYSVPKYYTDDMMSLEFDKPEGKAKLTG